MKLVSIAEASKTEGCPSRQKLTDLTKKEKIPPFFHKNKTWKIDIESEEFKAYIKKASKNKKNKTSIFDGGESIPRKEILEDKFLKKKVDPQIVKKVLDREEAEARIAEAKAGQEEIKLDAMLKRFINADTMQYYFSFFQRGIFDCFSSIKKINPDLERLYKAGKSNEAVKLILSELKTSFENAIDSLVKKMNSDLEEDER